MVILEHGDVSLAVGELRVRVECRPDRSQSNHGRTGRVLRPCVNPGSYEVVFDGLDERGHNWDYVHEEDLVVTAMNGHKIEKEDQLSIPQFLLRKEKRGGESPAERRERERVLASAKRGAASVSESREPPPFNTRTPKGGVDPKYAAEMAAAEEKRRVERAARREAEKVDRPKRSRVTVATIATEMSAGRASRVRKRDVKAWCRAAGVELPRSMSPEQAIRARAVVAQALDQGKPGVGRGGPARGTAAPAAPSAPKEPSVASGGSPVAAKPPKSRRAGALKGSAPVPPGMGKKARSR